jgi:UMF1 family MFS transporter
VSTANVAEYPKNDRRTIVGWAFFDWANSAYALVITAAIFPGYFLSVTDAEVDIFGMRMSNSTLYAWSISLAYLIIAFLSPILSGIADYSGRKKAFLRFFTLLGALACMSLEFFKGMPTLAVGVVGFVLATVGFAGGIVFYNSFLPVIATEDRYDAVSAQGFSYGYIGSVILLLVNLFIILNHDWFGITEPVAVRLAFLMVGLWWIGFSQIPLRRLPPDSKVATADNLVGRGYEELKKVWAVIRRSRNTLLFLASFFAYNSGTQAVLFLAATFAEKELQFKTSQLIVLILILQIVGIGGAWLLSKVSERWGNRRALLTVLVLWIGVCVAGYFVQTGLDFYVLAGVVGLAMGGTQSLSRSTYAKFLPENTQDTASYYSFYDVMDKVSTVMGTFVFGFVEQLTGGMRGSVLAMAAFFALGAALLAVLRVRKM